jgi:segregation and condensation protein A
MGANDTVDELATSFPAHGPLPSLSLLLPAPGHWPIHTLLGYRVAMHGEITPSPDGLQLHLEGFDGPLDLLLDLARRQQVDLAQISIVTLVDQYLAAVADLVRIDLTRAVEWLVMAAWLTWLKSRLLLPRELNETNEAERAAQVLTDRLAALERVRSAVSWLEARPQLGRDMYERGRPEPAPGPVVAADFLALFEACLTVLRDLRRRPPQVYRPPRPVLWTPLQAIARMRAMLAGLPKEHDLLGFVPPLPATPPNRALRIRAAIASTLAASLELARDAEVALQQEDMFGPIVVHPRHDVTLQSSGPAP